ncbi:Hypothetical protein CINCED_3A025189 [Cinara cedri]|uniref:Uncharacterized protein n=1 Tax=Cinara cedri TaxID=506608 RepID=A0A5E4MKC6_9HEMI|nr:Hypothetical protein CINCED_3A025189 [Cinara cedri]
MYIEEAIKETKDEIQVGVRVVGKNVIALRFADDKGFCTEIEVLQILHDKTDNLIGHILHHGSLLKLIIEGYVYSKIGRRRRRMKCVTNNEEYGYGKLPSFKGAEF